MARLPAPSPEVAALYDVDGDTLVSRETKWKTEIGNRAVRNRVEPHLKIRKWADTADECWLAVNFLDNLPGGDSAQFDGTAFVWSKGGYQVRIYTTGFDEGGGHNFDVVIPSRPPVNSITLPLNSSGCRFDYQPPLDPLGPPGVDQTAIINGTLFTMPWRACGSYAVMRADGKMHRWLDRNGNEIANYETGKICHIYRPHLTDALGNQAWADLSIVGNELTISVDPGWLDAATYPVTMDPDFGYTTAGASSSSIENELRGINQTPSTSGTLNSITVYIADTGGAGVHSFQVALWNSAGTTRHETSSSQSTASAAAAWQTTSGFTYSLTGSTAYALAIIGSGGGGVINFYYDTSSGLTTWNNLITFPTWPASLTSSSTTLNWSIYGTYTEGGGTTDASASSVGDALATATGASTTAVPANATGDSLATATGASVATSALNAAGNANATATGDIAGTYGTGDMSAAGDSLATANGAAIGASDLTADGVSSATAVGESVATGDLNATGDSLATAAGAATSSSNLNATGDSLATAVGDSVIGNEAALTADGTSDATATGGSIAAAVISADGTSLARAVGVDANAVTTTRSRSKRHREKLRKARELQAWQDEQDLAVIAKALAELAPHFEELR